MLTESNRQALSRLFAAEGNARIGAYKADGRWIDEPCGSLSRRIMAGVQVAGGPAPAPKPPPVNFPPPVPWGPPKPAPAPAPKPGCGGCGGGKRS